MLWFSTVNTPLAGHVDVTEHGIGQVGQRDGFPTCAGDVHERKSVNELHRESLGHVHQRSTIHLHVFEVEIFCRGKPLISTGLQPGVVWPSGEKAVSTAFGAGGNPGFTLSGKANREFEAGVAGWLAVEWSKFCNPGESPASVPMQFKPTNSTFITIPT